MDIPKDTLDFMWRWRAKGRQYDVKRLTHCFDGFFTAFVLYNLLYDLVCARKGAEYPYRGDEERATKVPKKFLGAAVIAADAELRNNAIAIKGLIEDGTFYIREAAWDRARIDKLNSNDPEQWSKGILEIVYKIRCNTFHGQKLFRENQKEILIPCIRILQRLNDMMIEKLAPNYRMHSAACLRGPRR